MKLPKSPFSPSKRHKKYVSFERSEEGTERIGRAIFLRKNQI
jgi:hypothetical protein